MPIHGWEWMGMDGNVGGAWGGPDSIGNSRAFHDPRPRILDSVGNSENDTFSFYVNLRVIDYPTIRFRDSGGGSEKRPRLSLERDATFVPKVSYFTVHFLAGSHRSRAGTP